MHSGIIPEEVFPFFLFFSIFAALSVDILYSTYCTYSTLEVEKNFFLHLKYCHKFTSI